MLSGRTWRRISYHPHNGGGGPAWNPALYNFHTYAGRTSFMALRHQLSGVPLAEGRHCILRICESDLRRLEKHLFQRYPQREWGTFFLFGYRRTSLGLGSLVCGAIFSRLRRSRPKHWHHPFCRPVFKARISACSDGSIGDWRVCIRIQKATARGPVR